MKRKLGRLGGLSKYVERVLSLMRLGGGCRARKGRKRKFVTGF